jgi:hypothetical protein
MSPLRLRSIKDGLGHCLWGTTNIPFVILLASSILELPRFSKAQHTRTLDVGNYAPTARTSINPRVLVARPSRQIA